MTEEQKVDYLEVDEPIPGQNFVCLSFVSPESIIQSQDSFKVAKFLQSYAKDKDLDVKKLMKEYDDFTYKYSDELQRDFDKENNFQTNVRGLKVRGTYSTKEEAERRAKSLQNIDSDFHVFVGQVGYWLPWDPCADKIEDEHYIDTQLNEMMQKYKENNIDRDIFYEEEKRDKVKAAREEVIRKKKEKMEEEKVLENSKEPVPEETPDAVKEILDGGGKVEDVVDDVKKVAEDVKGVIEGVKEIVDDVKKVEEEVNEVVDDVEKLVKDGENILESKVDEDVKASLESADPWLANKERK